MAYRPSIAERIAWTSGRLSAAEVKVLVALWSCGDYQTGRNCLMYVSTLVARSGLSRATVMRTLARLRDPTQPGGPWILASRRHRHATRYDLCLDRLATHPPKEQQMTMAADVQPTTKSESQNEPLIGFASQNEPQPGGSESHNETPTSDPDLDLTTHTARAREDTTATADRLPLLGRPPVPRCTHPHAHAWCEGRVHVPRDLHFELLDKLGTRAGESPTVKAGRLVAFYADTMAHLPPEADIADAYAFWKTAYKAWVTAGARRRGDATSGAAATLPACRGHHDPPCARDYLCIERTIAEGRAARQRKQA